MAHQTLEQSAMQLAPTFEVQEAVPAKAKSTSVMVLAVGQIPPPVNGQSLMIQAFLKGDYEKLKIAYVPMRFSRTSAELGKFDSRKFLILFSTLFQIISTQLQTGATVLYYPPADPNLVPVLRDLVLLIPSRWLFKKTVFHFHAAGLCSIYERLPKVLRPLFHLAYDQPDLAIFTTAATSADAKQLGAKDIAIVPCGIEDRCLNKVVIQDGHAKAPMILFAGILCEGKGVLDLLEACSLLRQDGVDFRVACLGEFQSDEFKRSVNQLVEAHGLGDRVSFPGVVTGAEKDAFFSDASVFCFPSHYNAESFGVVLIEAMSFSLPVVATDWRGIPEVLGRAPGDTNCHLPGARLVPICDPRALASALGQVLEDPAEREKMGAHNRAHYLESFTLDRYRRNLELHLFSLHTDEPDHRYRRPMGDRHPKGLAHVLGNKLSLADERMDQ